MVSRRAQGSPRELPEMVLGHFADYGDTWMAKVWANVCPKSPKRGPKFKQSMLFVIPEGQIHIFPTFLMVDVADLTSPDGPEWLSNHPGRVRVAPEFRFGGLWGS